MNSLSKWVRGKLQHHDDCHQMLNSLGQFTADMKHFMEDRRREMEEKLAARREAEELKRLEEGDEAVPSHGAPSKYFDQEQNTKGDTAWTSPRIAQKLALDLQLAKEQEAKHKMQEKEKAEKIHKITEIANLDAKTHVKKCLSGTSLLNNLPPSFSAGSHPARGKKATSVISISSSTSSLSCPLEPSPPKTKVEILPPKPSRKPKKMDILSDDEDMDDTVTGANVSKTTSRPSDPCVSNDKSVTVENGSGKFVEVEPSKPVASSRLSKFSFFKPKLTTSKEDATKKQDAPSTSKVSPAQTAPQSSNVTLSESSKRKKSESPECEYVPPKKLPQTSSRPWEDQGWLEKPVTDFESKKHKNIPECDFDLGEDFEDEFVEASVIEVQESVSEWPDDFEDDLVEEELASASAIQEQEDVSEWPDEDLNFDSDAFEEEPKATAIAPSSSRLSSSSIPRPTFSTASPSMHELPAIQVSSSSEILGNKSDAITDEDFIAQMIDRRKRKSGQKIPSAYVVPETPEEDSIVILDNEEVIWGTPQESASPRLANPEVKASSREVERSRPVGTADTGHRKPLFGRRLDQAGEQQRVNVEGGGEVRKHHPQGGGEGGGENGNQEVGGIDKKRWSSGEEVAFPEQSKPSLSSEDDIEEPPEIVVRKKMHVKGSQSAGQRPRPRKAKTVKNQRTRLSLSMRRENSDDDFL